MLLKGFGLVPAKGREVGVQVVLVSNIMISLSMSYEMHGLHNILHAALHPRLSNALPLFPVTVQQRGALTFVNL